MRIVIALLFSFCAILGADEILSEGAVHDGDYFASGDHIQILGVVKGDVYVLGSVVTIGGTVEGDVIASGGTIELVGEVLGDARLAGAQIIIKGTIRENCSAAGGNIQMTPSALIERNGVFIGGQVDLSGEIRGRARVTSSSAQILGQIGKDIKVSAGQLHIGPEARIIGNIEYSSGKEAVVDPGATIEGNLVFTPSAIKELFTLKWKERLIAGSKVLGILMNFFFTFIIGLLAIKLFPARLKAALNVLKTRPWKAVFVGLLILILLPIVCLILLITILGFPIALALIALSVLTFYSAKVIPILWISNAIFPKMGFKPNSLWVLFFGLILFFIALQIPIVGGLISISFILLGLGAGAIGRVLKG